MFSGHAALGLTPDGLVPDGLVSGGLVPELAPAAPVIPPGTALSDGEPGEDSDEEPGSGVASGSGAAGCSGFAGCSPVAGGSGAAGARPDAPEPAEEVDGADGIVGADGAVGVAGAAAPMGGWACGSCISGAGVVCPGLAGMPWPFPGLGAGGATGTAGDRVWAADWADARPAPAVARAAPRIKHLRVRIACYVDSPSADSNQRGTCPDYPGKVPPVP